MEFDRRRGHPALEFFDPGGDMDGFDRAQMGDAVGLRPGGEAGRGLGVGAAGVRVPDMGGEELDDAALGAGIRPAPIRRYGGGGALADNPNNILLLCETHHRLVDKVAKADYPADSLSAMRRRFCEEATGFLDALALAPTPAYCVAWPIHRQRIALPSSQQVARALKPIGARLDGQIRSVNDNDALLRSLDGEDLWRAIGTVVEQTAADILQQAHGEGYRAALFAMGLMPALIALGAKLGNKCEIIPMLRYRENGLWYWPVNEPRGEFYMIDGLDRLSDREGEVCLRLGLTAVPESMHSTAESLGMRVISVIARTEYLGNGALGHPDNGASFRQRMQELLHQLRDVHGAQTVHVLPCASNAACVFFGQSFDSYHPELVIYDFAPEGGCMLPRLRIVNVNSESEVKAVGAVADHLSYGEEI